LDTYQAVVSTFCEFLTVAIHTILYERNIYPRTSFLTARKYNYPVRQNRHPKVCKWIQDAVAAVEAEMLKGTVARTSLIIYSPTSVPLERFLFDTSAFPVVPPSEVFTQFESSEASAQQNPGAPPHPTVPIVDLEEQFRAIFAKLSSCSATLSPLPENCSFTIAVELKDRADPPIGHPQPWIPAQPSLQLPAEDARPQGRSSESEELELSKNRSVRGSDLGGVKTTPVRNVEAGEFVMEMWIEEGKGKIQSSTTSQSSDPP